MTDLPTPGPLPVDPNEAQRQQDQSSGGDTLSAVGEAIDVGEALTVAADLASDLGGIAVTAGAATVEAAASGVEIVGSLLGGLFDGL